MNVSPLPSFRFYRDTYISLSNLLLSIPCRAFLIPMVSPLSLLLLFSFTPTVSIASSSDVRFLRKANVVVRRS